MSDELANPHYIDGPPRGPAHSPPPHHDAVIDLEADAVQPRAPRECDGAD
jgi:hypothetical protein